MTSIRNWLLASVVLTAGCGMGEDKFIDTVTQTDCDYRIACYDPAVVGFNGWDTNPGSCLAAVRPEWEDRGASISCEYDKKTAKACVDALEAQAAGCPTEPTLPDVCQNVFTLCGDDGGDTDTTGGDDSAGCDTGECG